MYGVQWLSTHSLRRPRVHCNYSIVDAWHFYEIWCAVPVFSMTSTSRLDVAVRTPLRNTASWLSVFHVRTT